MANLERAILAGGCFWCLVKPFDKWEGVKSVISGYTGGHVENPTYEEVKADTTGHTEAVEITFDPAIISYETILDVFWQIMDPTDSGGQFGDRGTNYRPAIFYTTEEQKAIATASKEALQNSGRYDQPIIVPIQPAEPFYVAEEYHQDFYQKDPERYALSYERSGRKAYVEHLQEIINEANANENQTNEQ